MKNALVFGATGLIGKHLVKLLLDDNRYGKVHVFVRKAIPLTHNKLITHIIDPEDISGYKHLLKDGQVFCALGTTMKKAGSGEAFKNVDFHFPLRVAVLARENGVKEFFVISSIGADPDSSSFYLRVKGEMEQAVRMQGFQRVAFLRPSLLLGKRKEKRVGESIGKVLLKIFTPLMRGGLRKYRPIHAEKVARAMIYIANETPAGEIFETAELAKFAALSE